MRNYDGKIFIDMSSNVFSVLPQFFPKITSLFQIWNKYYSDLQFIHTSPIWVVSLSRGIENHKSTAQTYWVNLILFFPNIEMSAVFMEIGRIGGAM